MISINFLSQKIFSKKAAKLEVIRRYTARGPKSKLRCVGHNHGSRILLQHFNRLCKCT